MSDEAVLRIVVQDEGQGSFATPPLPEWTPEPLRPFSASEAAGDTRQSYPRKFQPDEPDDETSKTPGSQRQKFKADDLADEAEAIDAATRRYAELFTKGRHQPRPEKIEPDEAAESPAFDPVAAARQRLEREKRLQQVQAEYEKLAGTPPETPFDPVAEAQKKLEREKRLREVEAEYEKLAGGPQKFDPLAEAQKRLESERRKQQIEEAYQRIHPAEPEKPFDPFLEASKRQGKANQEKMVEDAERQLLLQQSAIGQAAAKVLGPTLGTAVAGPLGDALKAQFAPDAMRRIGLGAGYGGALGALGAAGANVLSKSAIAAPIMLGAELIGGAMRAASEQIRLEGELAGRVFATNDRFSAEIAQNRAILSRMENFGPVRYLSPSYWSLQRGTDEKEAAHSRQVGINQRLTNLAPFSPDIAAAQAQQRIGGIRQSMAEASLAGSQFAEFASLQAKMNQLQQAISGLEAIRAAAEEMRNMNQNMGNLQRDLAKQVEATTVFYRDQAEDRKKRAKSDEERDQITKDLNETLRRLQDVKEGKGKTPLEQLLAGLKLPDAKPEMDREQQIQNMRDNYEMGFGAFNF